MGRNGEASAANQLCPQPPNISTGKIQNLNWPKIDANETQVNAESAVTSLGVVLGKKK
jgi:hypothetical protein